MSYILALDTGNTTGFCIIDAISGTVIEHGHVKFKAKTGESANIRFTHFYNFLEDIFNKYPKINFLFYEMSHHFKAAAAARCHGGFIALLSHFCNTHSISYMNFSPTEVKKFASGSGNAAKPKMIESARILCPTFTGSDDNEADAICIAFYALSEYGSAVIAMTPKVLKPSES